MLALSIPPEHVGKGGSYTGEWKKRHVGFSYGSKAPSREALVNKDIAHYEGCLLLANDAHIGGPGECTKQNFSFVKGKVFFFFF